MTNLVQIQRKYISLRAQPSLCVELYGYLDSQNPEIQRPKGGVPTCGAKKGRSSRLRWWKRDSRCTTPRYSATPAWKGRINCGVRSQESSVSQVVPPIFAQLPIHDLARQCMKNKTAIAGMKWSENGGNIWTFGQISLDAESLVLREGSGWGREWGRGAHANHRTNPRRDGNPSTTARGAQRHHLDVLQAHWTPDAHASAESAHTLWVRDGHPALQAFPEPDPGNGLKGRNSSGNGVKEHKSANVCICAFSLYMHLYSFNTLFI